MTDHETRMWQALAAMTIDPPGAALGFVDRLARDNGWSRGHAAAVFEQYRRFLYLAATSDALVTPSDAVDQAWHLHLAYSRHYWEVLCGEIIGRPLHHAPTAGGGAERNRYHDQYAATLARYAETFGERPSLVIWPAPADRFAVRGRRIDAARNWVLPRRPAIALAAAAGLLAACTAAERDMAGNLLLLGVAIVVIVAIIRQTARRKGGNECDDGADDGDSSGCGGGCGGD